MICLLLTVSSFGTMYVLIGIFDANIRNHWLIRIKLTDIDQDELISLFLFPTMRSYYISTIPI